VKGNVKRKTWKRKTCKHVSTVKRKRKTA